MSKKKIITIIIAIIAFCIIFTSVSYAEEQDYFIKDYKFDDGGYNIEVLASDNTASDFVDDTGLASNFCDDARKVYLAKWMDTAQSKLVLRWTGMDAYSNSKLVNTYVRHDYNSVSGYSDPGTAYARWLSFRLGLDGAVQTYGSSEHQAIQLLIWASEYWSKFYQNTTAGINDTVINRSLDV